MNKLVEKWWRQCPQYFANKIDANILFKLADAFEGKNATDKTKMNFLKRLGRQIFQYARATNGRYI